TMSSTTVPRCVPQRSERVGFLEIRPLYHGRLGVSRSSAGTSSALNSPLPRALCAAKPDEPIAGPRGQLRRPAGGEQVHRHIRPGSSPGHLVLPLSRSGRIALRTLPVIFSVVPVLYPLGNIAGLIEGAIGSGAARITYDR